MGFEFMRAGGACGAVEGDKDVTNRLFAVTFTVIYGYLWLSPQRRYPKTYP